MSTLTASPTPTAVPPSIEVWRSVRDGGDTKTRKSRRTLALPAPLRRRPGAPSVAPDEPSEPATLAGDRARVRLVRRHPAGRGQRPARFRRSSPDAGLDPKEWTPRELRHSFVSLLSDNGVPWRRSPTWSVTPEPRSPRRSTATSSARCCSSGAIAMDQIFGRAVASDRRTVEPRSRHSVCHPDSRRPLHRSKWPSDLVGVAGFEPTTSSSRTKRATKLRHTPRRAEQ